jgi:hypothetical protein
MEAVVARAVRDRTHAEQLLQAAQKARRMVRALHTHLLYSIFARNVIIIYSGVLEQMTACSRSTTG